MLSSCTRTHQIFSDRPEHHFLPREQLSRAAGTRLSTVHSLELGAPTPKAARDIGAGYRCPNSNSLTHYYVAHAHFDLSAKFILLDAHCIVSQKTTAKLAQALEGCLESKVISSGVFFS